MEEGMARRVSEVGPGAPACGGVLMAWDDVFLEIAKRNLGPVASSDVFLVLFNDRLAEEPIPLIQIGLAIYLDKPIGVLLPHGRAIPENLRRLARAVIEYDPESGPTKEQVTLAALQDPETLR